MTSVALVVVNYRTADLAIEAIRSARASTGNPLQVIAVDNSVDAQQADMLRPHADIHIASETNAGYAAAINRARKTTDADMLIVANPDVVFGKEAIDRLIAAGADVAGPALYWDDNEEWLLPPAELHTALEVADRAIASRSGRWFAMRDRRRIRSRIAFWSLRDTTNVKALSGSVLAIRTAAFDRAGGFDERFRLYFEENDFLRRAGRNIVYVPSARCRHLYNQSAGVSPDAASLYSTSERAYLEKWNGAARAAMMKRIERPLPHAAAEAVDDRAIAVPPGSWIEASPLPTFDTAAGHRESGQSVTLPASIWDSYRGDAIYLRVVEPSTGRVLATYARSKIRG